MFLARDTDLPTEEAMLRKIFGAGRKRRSPQDCDHCLHDKGGMPLYAIEESVSVAVCCECGTEIDLDAP